MIPDSPLGAIRSVTIMSPNGMASLRFCGKPTYKDVGSYDATTDTLTLS